MNGDGQVQFPLVRRLEIYHGNKLVHVSTTDHRGASVQLNDNGALMALYIDGRVEEKATDE